MKTPGKKILLVEDEPAIRNPLARLLQMEGYEVAVADNGRMALEQLRAGAEPCLIILDLMMPVMDGQEFLDAVALEPKLSPIPVLVLSGDDRPPEKAISDRIVSYVTKPVEIEKLIEIIRRHC